MAAESEYLVQEVAWADAAGALMLVRLEVFVREQGVPKEMEWDGFDPLSRHVLAYDRRGSAVGTGRLLPDGHVGRLAVLKHCRGRGVGSAILARLVDMARARGDWVAVLNAQTHAVAFYERAGFLVTSDEFMEAGIPHVQMRLQLQVR